MSDSSLGTPGSRDTVRIALVVCCLLATVLAGTLLPGLTGGLADSPAGSMVPGDSLDGNATAGAPGGSAGSLARPAAGEGVSGGSGSLGALDPGDRTDVGGAVGQGNPYRSRDPAIHMTVRSPEPAYWRTGAYDTYTGSGWARNGGSRPYSGALGGGSVSGSSVQYQVTLGRSATALPTVWRPRSVDGVEGLRVTEDRALRSAQPLGSGTTYTAVSRRPPREPALLRATGRDYPAAIRQRYADPDVASDRLRRLTDAITAGTGNPYDAALAVERWLEAEKSYSLAASRTGEGIAETFVFRMEEGYCEYFATSMAVMLRSQGIPARYVVGYSTGQQVQEDVYSVRGLNAHAWVEVYFEEVGWVKFDPTPGSARLEGERRALQRSQPGTDYAPRERGSPGEAFTPEGSGDGAGDGTSDAAGATPTRETPSLTDLGPTENGTTERTPDGYQIRLNRSAVPGARVLVSVTGPRGGVAGVLVAFNGRPVGRTNANGVVTGTVPYARELRVTLGDGSGRRIDPSGAAFGTDRLYRVASRRSDLTVPVETNASIAVTGDRLPGATVGVAAAVGDLPVRNATVRVGGESVATTDDDGRARVALPATPGNVSVAVERGPVRGTTTVSVPELEVGVRSPAPLALPLTGGTVRVSAGDTPVGGAVVRIDGRRVATTGVNGTAAVSLPLASAATVSATANGVTGETSVPLLVNVLLVLAGLASLAGAAAYTALVRGASPGYLLAWLRRLPDRATAYAERGLLLVARRGDDLLERGVDGLRALIAGRAGPAELLGRVRMWLGGRLRELRRGHSRQGDGTNDGVPTEDVERPDSTDPYSEVRAAWRRFLGRLSLGRVGTLTPGELARHAVERDDLPAGPVRELRDAFREVEYGHRPAADRVDRVERALAAIEEAADGGDRAPDDTGEGGDTRPGGSGASLAPGPESGPDRRSEQQ
jgi:transglutaminase-like putative cysteine protease